MATNPPPKSSRKGIPNRPVIERIKQSKAKLEKMLLEKALDGDVEAIKECLRILEKEGQ